MRCSTVTRRDFIASGAALMAAPAGVRAATRDPRSAESLDADIRTYDKLGVHRTASVADHRTTAWLGRHMRALGYRVTTHPFAAERFEVDRAILTVQGRAARLAPQEPMPIERLAVEAPLRPLADGPGGLRGAITYADFPYRRDASLANAVYADLIARAAAAGAVALIAVTRGPTGQVIIFNVPNDGRPTPLPVFLLEPRDERLLRQSGAARLDLVARRRAGTAYNTLAQLDRGGPRLIVSTPQSGWTHCAGERGPGVALWRALAQMVARSPRPISALFIATSGHEAAHSGLESLLRSERALLARPFAAWIHLGANLATYDYQRDVEPLQLLPTPNPDRGVAASAQLLPLVREAFAGVPAMPVGEARVGAAFGEARTILGAGFEPIIGLVGSGVFHHVEGDRAGVSTSGALVQPLAGALAELCNRLT